MLPGFPRKKSLRLVRNLIIAEVVAYFAFLGLALSAYWVDIYRHFFLSKYASFTVVEFAGLAAVQIVVVAFVVMRSSQDEEQSIKEIIHSPEHEQLEFKTSLRWDVKRDQVNKDLEKGVMKTIAAFLNSSGGTLVVGVDDSREVFGLESDLSSLAKQNHDGWENHFNNIFVSMIGPEFRQHVKLTFDYINNKSIALVQVTPARRPAYVKTDKGEDFFIRTGNATRALTISQVAPYISAQWRQ